MERVLTSEHEDLSGVMDPRSLILLRWTLVLAVAALLLTGDLFVAPSVGSIFLLLAFASTNVTLYFYWDEFSTRPGTDTLVAVVDTLFLSAGIYQAGIAPAELFVLSFMVLLLVAAGRSLEQTVAAGAGVAFLYVWLTASLRPDGDLLSPAFLIRIPFLYSVALYYGYFAARAGEQKKHTASILAERRELHTLMDVLETINSTLDLHRVMLIITTKMAEAVGLERCSAVLVEADEKRGFVIASSDVPEVDRLELDLSKYPEVRRAIETRTTVLIEDVQNHPLMHGVKHFILGAGFNSILVVPMIHRDDLIGTLLLRAASHESRFSPRVVAFCQAIASASANALKNAVLYRQVREEAARHRATAEKLQNILQHSMDLIVTTDVEGRITDFNRTAEEALGFTRDEVLGQPLTELYRGGGDRTTFLSQLRLTGKIDDRGAPIRARDGSSRVFDLTVAVVRNDLGEVVGSVCVGKKAFAYQ